MSTVKTSENTESAETTAPSPAAPVATEKRKNVQVSTTIPAEYHDGLQDHKWSARIEVPAIVRAALDDYVAKHGIKVDGSAPVYTGK